MLSAVAAQGISTGKNWRFLFTPLLLCLCFLVLLFYGNTDFRTKCVHRNENGKAKFVLLPEVNGVFEWGTGPVGSNCRIPCHWKVAPLKIVATWPQSWQVTQGEDVEGRLMVSGIDMRGASEKEVGLKIRTWQLKKSWNLRTGGTEIG